MSARKFRQILPAVFFLVAAVILMVIGIRSDNYWGYAITAIVSAVFGLILAMALCSGKHHQELNAAKRRVKVKKPKDGLFGEDHYGLFKKDSSSSGSLDDLGNDDIDKKL